MYRLTVKIENCTFWHPLKKRSKVDHFSWHNSRLNQRPFEPNQLNVIIILKNIASGRQPQPMIFDDSFRTHKKYSHIQLFRFKCCLVQSSVSAIEYLPINIIKIKLIDISIWIEQQYSSTSRRTLYLTCFKNVYRFFYCTERRLFNLYKLTLQTEKTSHSPSS